MDPSSYHLEPADPRFADADSGFNGSKYVFFGVPFDATSSHMSGSRNGPASIREESYNFETYLMDINVDLIDIKMCDLGNVVMENLLENQEEVMGTVYSLASKIFSSDKIPFLIGGEHSLTEPAVDAFMDKYDDLGGVALILDAHLDFRDQYMDNPHSHACVTRRIFEKWGRDSVCVIGARSGSKEEVEEAKKEGLRYFTSDDVIREGIIEIMDNWDTDMALRERPIYLSLDMDAIDPSDAPGTGTPEPWGLTSLTVRRLIEDIYGNLKGMDVMEVSPDVERYITSGLAGKLLRRTIGLMEMEVEHPTWLERV